jgi:hypothetical protein
MKAPAFGAITELLISLSSLVQQQRHCATHRAKAEPLSARTSKVPRAGPVNGSLVRLAEL